MAPPTTTTSVAQGAREGLSPSPQPFGLAEIWEDDDDDMEYEPASEEGISQSETDGDGESFYMGMAFTPPHSARTNADMEQMPKTT